MIAEISEEEFNNGVADIDLGGSEMVQIQEINGVWKVTNAMNGYGYNTRHEYNDAKVEPIKE